MTEGRQRKVNNLENNKWNGPLHKKNRKLTSCKIGWEYKLRGDLKQTVNTRRTQVKTLRSRLIGLCFMECPDQVWSIAHIRLGFPTGRIGCVVETLPLDQIEKTRAFVAAVNFTIKYLLHLIFVRVVELQRGWRVLDTVGNSTGTSGLKEGDMEDRVYALKRERESQSYCMRGHHLHNWERAEVSVVQFFGRAIGTNVPCIEPDSVTNLEVGNGQATVSCMTFVLLQGALKLVTKILIELLEVGGHFVSAFRWDRVEGYF